MTVSRLAPGVEIVAVPGLGVAVRTQDGEFLRVDTGEVAAEDLIGRFEGGPQGTPALENLVQAFESAGYAGSDDERPLEGRTVFLLGEATLTGRLARRIAAEGADVKHIGPDEVAAMSEKGPRQDVTAAVVWCLDSPVPDGLWEVADRLPERGIGWLRCHREGFQAWIEPLAAAPGDVTSADVRLRRLAATAAHRELAAYWAGSRSPESGGTGGEASAALIVELLTADLVAWAGGRHKAGRVPVRRRLRRVDLRDLTVTEHLVLPVPAVAPLHRPGTPATAGARGAAR
ncbi:hypothetical protein J7E96_14400 [Streptomyces sp. ISL-96]|uniref:hypothetical protein n=1 Tax=Streptomyces sp. ISL-96 TaxID=2819191 RepID=UPI001BE67BFB|nr:hypothetical protein [Streptomyces sp. ISL-96]MBT2489683.1 hypothetical protein [Streptomyces sp. ISL-96]